MCEGDDDCGAIGRETGPLTALSRWPQPLLPPPLTTASAESSGHEDSVEVEALNSLKSRHLHTNTGCTNLHSLLYE